MMKQTLFALAASLPLAATELPPLLETGPIHYDDVTYQPAPPDYAGTGAEAAYQTPGYGATPYGTPTYAPMPLRPAASHNGRGEIVLNAYSSNYQVRGMGVTNQLSNYGWSSVYGSCTMPNRNLFNLGIHQRVSGTFGAIWGAKDALGDTPMFNLNYAVGREILPNLVFELGYSLRRGGFEGFMARATGAPHRFTQDFNCILSFNDQQHGVFAHVLYGYGFQGLIGNYLDGCVGYRITDIAARGNVGTDLELSGGVSASFGYWGGGVEGVDAYRLRAALRPYSHTGTFGRDARVQVTPWVQCSWTGHNASKIDRCIGGSPADHFQLTFGIDLAYKF